MRKVIGGADLRISMVDNDKGGLGTILKNDHIVKEFAPNRQLTFTRIPALGTNRAVDEVPGVEEPTYNLVLSQAYDDADPVRSFAESITKVKSALGKTNLTISLTLYQRGKSQLPDRDDYIIDVVSFQQATIRAMNEGAYSAESPEAPLNISGSFRYVTSKNAPQYSDKIGG